jgi:hypothetical protein
MMPFLWDGDVVLVTPTAATEVDVGDVICYEASPGRLSLHRVIARSRDRFVAKGDALAVTEIIDRTQLLGKAVAVERHGSVKRLDTRIARWRNRAIAAASTLIPLALALAIGVRRAVRAAFHG